jgi:phosphopantetheine adenylyltransferase
MKVFILFSLFILSDVYAQENLEKRILKLEKRVKKLESLLMRSDSALRTKNMKNKKMKRVLGDPTDPNKELSNLTPKQQAEIELIIKKFRENQEKSQQALEELMQEP